MPARPNLLPQFAAAASPGQIVEPAGATLSGGFNTDDRPPAQWFNWLFNVFSQWVSFFRAPSQSNWNRSTLANALGFGGCDVNTVETLTGTTPLAPLRRFAAIGTVGTDTHVYTSVSGDSWRQDAPFGGPIGNMECILWSGSRWIIGTSTPAIYWTWPDGSTNPSAITSPGSVAWTIATGTAPASAPLAIAVGQSGKIVAVTATQILYSSTNGTIFAAATVSPAPAGNFTDVVWSGSAWIAITDQGEYYETADATTTWSKKGSFAVAAPWHLATDGTIRVVAYIRNNAAGDGVNWEVTVDNASSWSTVSPIYRPNIIVYDDGAWFVTSAQGARLLVTNDITSGNWLGLPFPIIEGATFGLVNVIVGLHELVAFTDAPAVMVSRRAEDIAPGPWVPFSAPIQTLDCGYLRGIVVDGTTPVDGEILRFNHNLDEWELWGRSVTTGAANYTATGGEKYIGVDDTTAARVIVLPPSPVDGDRITIKDESNGAATHNITIQPSGLGPTIDGVAAIAITTNRGAYTLFARGGNWWIESKL